MKKMVTALLAACLLGLFSLPAGASEVTQPSGEAVLPEVQPEESETVNITLKDTKKAYDGKEKTISEADTNGSAGTVVYTYYIDQDCTMLTTSAQGAAVTGGAPVKIGTYYVKAVFTESTSGSAVESNIAILTVTKGKSTITLKSKTLTYNGKKRTVDQASITGSTGSVAYVYYKDAACTKKTSSSDGASSEGRPPVNAGTYYVRALVRKSDLYNGSKSKPVKLIVKKADPVITASSKKAGFSGQRISAAPAKATLTTSKVGYIYYKNKSLTQKTTVSDGASAAGKAPAKTGTYYVKVYVKADKNCNAAAKKVKLIITEPTLSASGATYYYDGNYHSISSSCSISGESAQAIYYSDDYHTKTNYTDGAASVGGAPRYAGKYRVLFVLPATSYHKQVALKSTMIIVYPQYQNYPDYIQYALCLAADNSVGYGHGWAAYSGSTISCAGLVGVSLSKFGYLYLMGDYVYNGLNWGYMDNTIDDANYRYQFVANSFQTIPFSTSNLQVGDILYSAAHTEIYIGNGLILGSRDDYNGDGNNGVDASGTEISVISYVDLGFNTIYRPSVTHTLT